MTQLEQFKAMLEGIPVLVGELVVEQSDPNPETGDILTSIIFKHHSGLRCQFDFWSNTESEAKQGWLQDVFVGTMPDTYVIGPMTREEYEEIAGPLPPHTPLTDEELAEYDIPELLKQSKEKS